MKAGKVDG